MEAQEGIIKEMIAWWTARAEEEVQFVAPKAAEYGSSDLRIMGEAMRMQLNALRRARGELNKATKAEGMEMAIAFYALGKVARLFGAYERGAMPSDDTWADLGIYCRMAQRVRDTGGWV